MVASVGAMKSSVAPCALSNSFILRIVGPFAHFVPNRHLTGAGTRSTGGSRGGSVTAMRCSGGRMCQAVRADRRSFGLSRWYG